METLTIADVVKQVESFQERLLEAHARIAPILDRVRQLEQELLRLSDLSDGVLLALDQLDDQP